MRTRSKSQTFCRGKGRAGLQDCVLLTSYCVRVSSSTEYAIRSTQYVNFDVRHNH